MVLMLLTWGGYEVNGRLQAQRLRDKLLGSPLADVPGIIVELKPYRRWVDPLLRQADAEAREAGTSEKHLHAALALLDVDHISELPYLKDRLFRADAQSISVLRRRWPVERTPSSPNAGGSWSSRDRKIKLKHSRRPAPWRSTTPGIRSGRRSVPMWRTGSLPRMPTWWLAGSMPFALLPGSSKSL